MTKEVFALSDGTLVTDEIALGDPQPCSLRYEPPKQPDEIKAIYDAGPFRFVETQYGVCHVLRTPDETVLIEPHHFEHFKKLMRAILGGSPKETPETRVLSALEADEGEG